MDPNKLTLAGLISVLVISIAGNIYQSNLDIPENHNYMCIKENEIIETRYCNHISGGLGTRCYPKEENKNWRTCNFGWEKIDKVEYTYQRKKTIICTKEGCN